MTNNDNARISSSLLFAEFKSRTNTKMTSSKFKDDMLGISGITTKRITAGVYFIGLKKRPEITDVDE